MIRIQVNEDEISLENGDTIDALLKQLAVDDTGRIAIAVNDMVIRRAEWSSHPLNDHDRVLMIAPIQGG